MARYDHAQATERRRAGVPQERLAFQSCHHPSVAVACIVERRTCAFVLKDRAAVYT
jgi:hypothetical protein